VTNLKFYQFVTPAQMNTVALPLIALVLLSALLCETLSRPKAIRPPHAYLRILFFGFLTCTLLSPFFGKYPPAAFWDYYYHLHLLSVICLTLASVTFFYFDKNFAWLGLISAALGTLVLLGPVLVE
jgi:hypothetical protein